VEGFSQNNNSVAAGLAVVDRERDIALAIVKRCNPSDKTLAALLLLAPHLLSGPAQGGTGKA
jgi:hypothetical protein